MAVYKLILHVLFQLFKKLLPFGFVAQLIQTLLFTVSLILYWILFYTLAISPGIICAPAHTTFKACCGES